jgi:hypothetical protein
LELVLLAMADGDKIKPKHVIVTIGKHGVLVGSINQERDELERLVASSDFPVEIWGEHKVHGSHGMGIVHIPGVEVVAKNCTGAGKFCFPTMWTGRRACLLTVPVHPVFCCSCEGDSLVGGTVYGLLNGHDILRSCHLGMIAARQSLASDHAINPSLSPSVLRDSA